MSTDITIFSTSICAICEAEMKWLDKKGVGYSHIVVDESDEGMEQFMVATGGIIQSPPFTVIKKADGTEIKVAGFDMKKLTAAIS
jgi:glutaredoxin